MIFYLTNFNKKMGSDSQNWATPINKELKNSLLGMYAHEEEELFNKQYPPTKEERMDSIRETW